MPANANKSFTFTISGSPRIGSPNATSTPKGRPYNFPASLHSARNRSPSYCIPSFWIVGCPVLQRDAGPRLRHPVRPSRRALGGWPALLGGGDRELRPPERSRSGCDEDLWSALRQTRRDRLVGRSRGEVRPRAGPSVDGVARLAAGSDALSGGAHPRVREGPAQSGAKSRQPDSTTAMWLSDPRARPRGSGRAGKHPGVSSRSAQCGCALSEAGVRSRLRQLASS